MYDKFLIEWVAIQYHWILDSSCLYLARPQILHILVQYPVILDSYPFNKVYMHKHLYVHFLRNCSR